MTKVLLTLRDDYIEALDALVDRGVAHSRSALVERIVGGFLSDLKAKRKESESAMGSLVGFVLFLIGVKVLSEILGGSD